MDKPSIETAKKLLDNAIANMQTLKITSTLENMTTLIGAINAIQIVSNTFAHELKELEKTDKAENKNDDSKPDI